MKSILGVIQPLIQSDPDLFQFGHVLTCSFLPSESTSENFEIQIIPRTSTLRCLIPYCADSQNANPKALPIFLVTAVENIAFVKVV